MKSKVSLALSEELVREIDKRRSTDQGEIPRSAFVEKELKKTLLPAALARAILPRTVRGMPEK